MYKIMEILILGQIFPKFFSISRTYEAMHLSPDLLHLQAEEWAAARSWTAKCGMGDKSLLNSSGGAYPLAGLKSANFDSPYQYGVYIW